MPSTITLVKEYQDSKLGLSLEGDGSRPAVKLLVPGGLAESSGLQVGDAIVSVNSEAVMGATDATDKMKAASGSVLVEFMRYAAPTRGGRDLYLAAEKGDLAAVKEQLSRGANVAHREPPNHWDSLKVAIKGGHLEIVQLLLDAGADVYTINLLGANAFGIAFRYSRPYSVAGGQMMQPAPQAQAILDLIAARDPKAMADAKFVEEHQGGVYGKLGCCSIS